MRNLGVNPDKKIINSCGSGITACVIDTALMLTGKKFEETQIYDGSWAEYGFIDEPKFD